MKVYVIGSLRNPEIPQIASALRGVGHEVFDDWFAAGPEADDYWSKYEKERGRTYEQALTGHAANHVFHFDKKHLDNCDAAVLVLPAGRSGHLELGYCAGLGKQTYILLGEDHNRWDVMYRFATKVVPNLRELLIAIKKG